MFKRGRWVDAQGRKCRKGTPGAQWEKSRFWTVQVCINGKIMRTRGYKDKQASEQLGARLEKAKARGAEGLDDPYKSHRNRRLKEHVADWIAELRQLGRDEVYVRLCESRMARLIDECGWATLGSISADGFIRWRQTATSTVGKAAKRGTNVKPMGARTQNHYLETLRTFCGWAMRRKRMSAHELADVSPVETAGQLRRQRRALTDDQITALLGAVPPRHQLAYRVILATGLRRNELRQLCWGDVKLNAPLPCIQLRAETTKAKRADVLPLRGDVANLLKEARGEAGDGQKVCRTLPSMDSHKRYLGRAGITFEDEQGRRADFHALRHTYGTMLAKAGVAPRLAMRLLRHADMKLTMNVYTDPRVFDLAGAVEKLPALATMDSHAKQTPWTQGTIGRSESVSSPLAGIGVCSAVIGGNAPSTEPMLTLATGGNRRQKTAFGTEGERQQMEGTFPST